MGQITNPAPPGITVNPIDRQTGPAAGAGATGNNSLFLGANAGRNSASSNMVILGSNSGDAGIVAAALTGTTIVGAFSGQALVGQGTTAPGTPGAMTIIGSGTLNAQTLADSSVLVGAGILPNDAAQSAARSIEQSVLVGNAIGAQALTVGIQKSVILGYLALGGAVNFGQTNDVLIGYNAAGNMTSSLVDAVMIGANVGQSVGSTGFSNISQQVIIGSQADAGANSPGNVIIGFTARSLSPAVGNNVVIGLNATGGALADLVGNNVVIGAGAQNPANTTGGFNIIIGPFAGLSLPAANSNQLVIENNVQIGGAQHSLIYGDFSVGNLILGGSVDTVNRDFGGAAARNIVKIINGVKGGVNPVGGGYFYVTAGFLHYVDTAGVDSQLSVTAAGQLAANALTAYTNNAAANVGTLTNSPLTGNPTKWIPINDAGTIRNIPAW